MWGMMSRCRDIERGLGGEECVEGRTLYIPLEE